jgi:hypothetical protein
MENLTAIEEEILKFLRRSFHIPKHSVKSELEGFLTRIKQFERQRFQTRVFVYLDIVSWVEHKVYNKPLGQVIEEKYARRSKLIQKEKAVENKAG